MQITTAVGVAFLLAATAQGESGSERQVTVYVRNGVVPFAVIAQADALATGIFAGVGVTLNLLEARPPRPENGGIIIEFVNRTPAGLLPRAWAYALPYEGAHIRIFWDRLQLERCPERLLAYVMVHEITHMLQGLDGHAEDGIMHARWSGQERRSMERSLLHFAPEDVEMIYRGMDSRGALAPTVQ
jgi:hypothetical protein